MVFRIGDSFWYRNKLGNNKVFTSWRAFVFKETYKLHICKCKKTFFANVAIFCLEICPFQKQVALAAAFSQGTLKIEGRTTHKFVYTRLLKFLFIFTRYSDRSLLLGSGSLSLNSVFPTEMGNNFKTTDDFAEIYTSCVHKLTSLP